MAYETQVPLDANDTIILADKHNCQNSSTDINKRIILAPKKFFPLFQYDLNFSFTIVIYSFFYLL